ncbi:MAG: hypothetical protein VYC07_06705 [Pseudomonadota bacterium]|nr:hypothetical protein [Pseudomonadota bacterium]
MTAELDNQENEDPKDAEDTPDNADDADTISDASVDDLAGDDGNAEADPDALVDEKRIDDDLSDIRRRIEKLEEAKRLQSDLDYLDEGFDD